MAMARFLSKIQEYTSLLFQSSLLEVWGRQLLASPHFLVRDG